MDFLFSLNRKIADRIFVPLFMRTPLRPNHITILSLLSGIAAAAFIAHGSRPDLLTGAFLLQLSFILDNCDGTVARLKSMRSAFGMWLDLIADLFVDFSLWAALATAAIFYEGVDPWLILPALIGALAGSIINFLRVVRKKLKGQTGKEVPRARNAFFSAIHVLGHDGDPTIFIWILAAVATPAQFLFAGLFYIYAIWIADTLQAKASA